MPLECSFLLQGRIDSHMAKADIAVQFPRGVKFIYLVFLKHYKENVLIFDSVKRLFLMQEMLSLAGSVPVSQLPINWVA